MSFEQDIAAIEGISVRLRQREQNEILLENQAKGLEMANTQLRSTLAAREAKIAHLEQMVERIADEKDDYKGKSEQQLELIGSLKENLRRAVQDMVQASDNLATGLKECEVPKTLHPATTQEEFKKPQFTPWRDVVGKLVSEERKEALANFGEGSKIIFGPSDGIGEKRLRHWYKLHSNGACPGNWADKPEIEAEIRGDKVIFLRFIPRAKEVESQKPFRPDITNPSETLSGAAPSFTSNGQDIPGFLKKGPAYDDNLGRSTASET